MSPPGMLNEQEENEPDWQALGRRALAAGWTWKRTPGALVHGSWCRVVEQQKLAENLASPHTWVFDSMSGEWRLTTDEDVPDLRDAATLGCLLTLVREAWPPVDNREQTATVVPGADGYTVHYFKEGGWNVDYGECDVGYFPTEAEALVAALEAASVPCQEQW